ncbi:nitroreductase family protein [Acuticoccus mangrovi]|uniref:Putative NAD(P)H nitroreductase n=1 Tax=Acuticoccus mangrovi TaxID=2796142 RepID=A0A934MGE2_9HYPH|nr:nitroreductase [Acuticoccus mangrovi]MBJ3774881.1 nitroreductase [Acuticoccus mangrovi]
MVALRDYLATRRTIPSAFLGEPGPDPATLEAMLTIAARVPDHGKLAPWRFIVFEGEGRKVAGERVAKLAQASGKSGDIEAELGRFLRSPTVVAVVSRAAPHVKIPEWEQVLSAGAVCLNLLHAAAAYGFSAQWLSEWIAYDRDALATLGVAEGEKIAGFIHIGTPEAAPFERARPDVAALTTRFDPSTTPE